jgi:hypothetical protein
VIEPEMLVYFNSYYFLLSINFYSYSYILSLKDFLVPLRPHSICENLEVGSHIITYSMSKESQRKKENHFCWAMVSGVRVVRVYLSCLRHK